MVAVAVDEPVELPPKSHEWKVPTVPVPAARAVRLWPEPQKQDSPGEYWEVQKIGAKPARVKQQPRPVEQIERDFLDDLIEQYQYKELCDYTAGRGDELVPVTVDEVFFYMAGFLGWAKILGLELY
jgi:hypothetical protein